MVGWKGVADRLDDDKIFLTFCDFMGLPLPLNGYLGEGGKPAEIVGTKEVIRLVGYMRDWDVERYPWSVRKCVP
jgi:hypothetical protein